MKVAGGTIGSIWRALDETPDDGASDEEFSGV
jgi:hypothetical protein